MILLPQQFLQGPLLPQFFSKPYFLCKVTPLVLFPLAWHFSSLLIFSKQFMSHNIYPSASHTIHFHYSTMIWLYPSFLKYRMPELLWKATCQNVIKMFSLLHCLREMNGLLNHQLQIYIQFWKYTLLRFFFPSYPE